MTVKNTNIKKKNNRYIIVSHAKELLTRYFVKEYENKTYSDMYEDIGLYCGISPSTVSQIRIKNLAPSYIVAIKLSELLGVKPTDIWEVVEAEDYSEGDSAKCRVFGCDRIATTRGYCMKHVYVSKNEIERERENN